MSQKILFLTSIIGCAAFCVSVQSCMDAKNEVKSLQQRVITINKQREKAEQALLQRENAHHEISAQATAKRQRADTEKKATTANAAWAGTVLPDYVRGLLCETRGKSGNATCNATAGNTPAMPATANQP